MSTGTDRGTVESNRTGGLAGRLMALMLALVLGTKQRLLVDPLAKLNRYYANEFAEMGLISAARRDAHLQLVAEQRAQSSAGGLASLFIGLMIAGIIAVQVFIPVINDAIASSNATGTTKTILELLPLFAGLLLLIALASPLMRRT